MHDRLWLCKSDLKGRCEAIEDEVGQHEDAPKKAGFPACLRFSTPAKKETCTASCDEQSRCVVLGRIGLARDEGAPNHDWDHLGAFAQSLDREGNILQGLVLTGGCNHIAEGYCCIACEGCCRGQWLLLCLAKQMHYISKRGKQICYRSAL